MPTLYVLLKVCENSFVKISACIITFNEEKNISEAVKSLDWADEVLIVDSFSSDTTITVAESLNAKVILQEWLGFSKQKQFATDRAENDWILSLDADERVSVELRNEILNIKSQPQAQNADGYKIPRLSFYMNRPIRHSGWYPDWQLRLFNRRKAKWKDVPIHESILMENNSKVEKLKGEILHYSVENASYHHKMIGERYAPLAAGKMFDEGKRTTPLKIVSAGISSFVQTYFLKLGFLDGLPGFCIAKFAAHHAFLKHLLLYEKQNERSEPRIQL